MTFDSLISVIRYSVFSFSHGVSRPALVVPLLLGAVLILAGCESPAGPSGAKKAPASSASAPVPAVSPVEQGSGAPAPAPAVAAPGPVSDVVTIREGDVLKISFPGAPMLDTTQQVRADGVVTLDTLGEVKVTGMSPKELQTLLAQKLASQLVSNEVVVAIVSSSFDVYVTGAVLRPGKITANKPITAFQAIMEAGYDPVNSNLEKVTLIRVEGGSKYTYIPLNLQLVLDGKETEPYYLKPSDTLQVPKKISIF